MNERTDVIKNIITLKKDKPFLFLPKLTECKLINIIEQNGEVLGMRKKKLQNLFNDYQGTLTDQGIEYSGEQSDIYSSDNLNANVNS